MVTGKVPQKYPLNIIFLKRFTVFSSMPQWSIRLSGGQAIRVQSAISFLFFSFLFFSFFLFLFLFFFFFGGGGRGGGGGWRRHGWVVVVCSALLFSFFLFFPLFDFPLFPLLNVSLIFTRFCDTRISRY